MPSLVRPGPVQEDACIRQAVCISTRKIIDSCRARDCTPEVRLWLPSGISDAVTGAAAVRGRGAQLMHISTRVEEVTFRRGYYSVDAAFYYRITGDAVSPLGQIVPFAGLAIFPKRVILRGGTRGARVFSGGDPVLPMQESADPPAASVEAVDPVLLGIRLGSGEDGGQEKPGDIPTAILSAFDGALTNGGARGIYVTLGQFSAVYTHRPAQLVIPAYDDWVPEKEAAGTQDASPGSLFSALEFPAEAFLSRDGGEDTQGS